MPEQESSFFFCDTKTMAGSEDRVKTADFHKL